MSPERTSTSSTAPSSASRAQRTASPVPRGSSWTTTGMPSNAAAVAGAATTTSGSTPSARADSSTQSTIRRPRIGCRCFGTSERMRVPSPAAMTTAPRVLSPFDDTEAGAPGFEPGITGPKPVALPLGHAPLRGAHLASHGRSTASTGRVTIVRPCVRPAPTRPRRRRRPGRRGRRRSGRRPTRPRGRRPAAASSRETADEARSFGGSAARSRASAIDSSARVERRRALGEAVRAASLVERVVDGGGGRLRLGVRHDEHDVVVDRERDWRELGSVARSRPALLRGGRTGRPRRQRAATPCSALVSSGSDSSAFASTQRRRGVAASTSEPGGDRDALLDPYAPARLDSCGHGEGLEGASHDRVLGEALDRELVGGLEHDVVVDVASRWSTVTISCLPSPRSGPTTRPRLIFAKALRTPHRRCFRELDELLRLELLRARAWSRRPIAVRASSTRERVREPREGDRVGERLSSVRERRLDDRPDRPRSGRSVSARRRRARIRRADAGERRLAARDGTRSSVRRAARERRRRRTPWCAAARKAIRDLALHHHAPVLAVTQRARASRRRAASRCCTGGWRRASSAPGEEPATSRSSASPQLEPDVRATHPGRRAGPARASDRAPSRGRLERDRRGSA